MKPKPVVYLSGPMTGHPEYNYPLFHSVTEILRGEGLLVFNPAETIGGDYTHDIRPLLLMHDIQTIMTCVDYVLVLPGWKDSEGSRLEVLVAQMVGVPVVQVDEHGNIGLGVPQVRTTVD